MALARHVGGAGRHLLGGDGRSGDDEHLGAREHAGQSHLDVPGPGGHVDEEVVERSPADVLEELLDGPVQDEAPPHDGGLLVGEEPHRHHLEQAGADGLLEGHDLLALGAQLTSHPEQARDREPPDVGVEEPDHEPPLGERHRQVDGDRGLAHPALPRRHGQDPGGGGDVGRQRPVLLCPAPGPVHEGAALGGVHLAHHDLDDAHAGQAAHPGLDVGPQLGPQGAAGDGQGDLHLDPSVGVHRHGPHHAEVDDVVAELGVDHAQQCGTDRLLGRGRGRGRHSTDPTVHLVRNGPEGLATRAYAADGGTGSDKVVEKHPGPWAPWWVGGRWPRPEEAER